ncbi:SRPBCC domain-containing protein [Caldalkalibacillus salinus]|uniref:SRPBCC domain-containing protein n=1 Tax=Caldalkalibacillus salinus TaxID=2803787 RepID=UPI001921D315|nr:SRPBCC domain-containing protein [Caldalkalibacillus salinus]
MFEIKTEIEINGTAKEVWSALVTTDQYPKWNPFIISVKGKIEKDSIIEIIVQPAGEKGMRFKPKITSYEVEKELRWLGSLPIPGLFSGEHIYQLNELENGAVKFIHRETFKGLLVPFMKSKLNRGTKQGFEDMNKALKEYVER